MRNTSANNLDEGSDSQDKEGYTPVSRSRKHFSQQSKSHLLQRAALRRTVATRCAALSRCALSAAPARAQPVGAEVAVVVRELGIEREPMGVEMPGCT